MAVPEAFYREAIDLNRYSNKVQFQIATQFNEIILDVLRQIRDLEGNSPATQARLQSILSQMVESLKGWENKSAIYMIEELQNLTEFQVGFVQDQLQRVLPKGEFQVNTVAISPDFAKSIVTRDPTALTIRLRDKDGIFRTAQFALTAKRGSDISLPNGKTVKKAFRGIADDSASRLSKAIRLGVAEGESLPKIVRRLKGPNLGFNAKPQNAIALNSALKDSEGMLLSNKQIQVFILTNGNEMIAEIQDDHDDYYRIMKPASVVPDQTGKMNLVPSALTFNMEKSVRLNKSSVAMVMEPNSSVEETYNKITSKIITPNKPTILKG